LALSGDNEVFMHRQGRKDTTALRYQADTEP
jgi:hypothetical protein